MNRPISIWPLLGLAVMAPSAPAQVPTPSAHAAQSSNSNAREERPEYVIVFWYDRSRPVETFHYQVYDARKGEFSPAVRTWLSETAKRFPHYAAYGRELRLDRAAGATERLKVGRAIMDELSFLVGAQGGPVPAGAYSGRGRPGERPRQSGPLPWDRSIPGLDTLTPAAGGFSRPGLPGDGRPLTGPATAAARYPFPTPFPYPRPHP